MKEKAARKEEDSPVARSAVSKRRSPVSRGLNRRDLWFGKGIRWARVGAYAGVVGIGLAALATASAYGDVKRTALELGSELGTFDDIGAEGRPILLNGQPVYLSSTIQDIPVETILDRIEEHCERNANGLKAELENLPEAVRKELAEDMQGAEASHILREEEGDRGVVVCVVDEKERPILDRIQKFGETGNLSELGQLRYVYARRTDQGSTHVIATWTDGPFHLPSFFPVEGDAPGEDPFEAVRPPSSKRLLEARIKDVPYGTWVYSSTATVGTVVTDIDTGMVEKGWRPMLRDFDKQSFVYSKGGRDLYISATPHKGQTIVSMVQIKGD